MTTQRKSEANRENASRSTGPRSGAGKKTASGNAIRHGATRRPDADLILSFFRLIAGDGEACSEDIAFDRKNEAAYGLAEAEARLMLARQSFDDYLSGTDVEQGNVEGEAELEDALAEMRDMYDAMSRENREFFSSIDRFLQKSWKEDRRKHMRRGQLLRRYLRDAETRREAALKDWLKILEDEKRNEAKCNS